MIDSLNAAGAGLLLLRQRRRDAGRHAALAKPARE